MQQVCRSVCVFSVGTEALSGRSGFWTVSRSCFVIFILCPPFLIFFRFPKPVSEVTQKEFSVCHAGRHARETSGRAVFLCVPRRVFSQVSRSTKPRSATLPLRRIDYIIPGREKLLRGARRRSLCVWLWQLSRRRWIRRGRFCSPALSSPTMADSAPSKLFLRPHYAARLPRRTAPPLPPAFGRSGAAHSWLSALIRVTYTSVRWGERERAPLVSETLRWVQCGEREALRRRTAALFIFAVICAFLSVCVAQLLGYRGVFACNNFDVQDSWCCCHFSVFLHDYEAELITAIQTFMLCETLSLFKGDSESFQIQNFTYP